jgi:holin-like protein
VIAGLVEILLFQGVGELVSHFLLASIPGPVVGLVLLIGWLQVRKRASPGVELVAGALVQHLGLLFVPAAVGVVMFWPQLRSAALAVGVSLVVSVVLTVAVTALVLKLAGRDDPEPRPHGDESR